MCKRKGDNENKIAKERVASTPLPPFFFNQAVGRSANREQNRPKLTKTNKKKKERNKAEKKANQRLIHPPFPSFPFPAYEDSAHTAHGMM